jgi:hypothetical protein
MGRIGRMNNQQAKLQRIEPNLFQISAGLILVFLAVILSILPSLSAV